MRAIDADKLCEDLLTRWSIADEKQEQAVREIMANVVTPIVVSQPTITADRPSAVDLSSVYSTAYKSGYEKGKADRPRGEWVAVRSFEAFGGDYEAWMAHGDPIAFHYCSNCREQTYLDEDGKEILSKFCPFCGADMRAKESE